MSWTVELISFSLKVRKEKIPINFLGFDKTLLSR